MDGCETTTLSCDAVAWTTLHGMTVPTCCSSAERSMCNTCSLAYGKSQVATVPIPRFTWPFTPTNMHNPTWGKPVLACVS